MKIILLISFILFELFATSQTVNGFNINSKIDGTHIVTLNDVELHIDPATGGRISAFSWKEEIFSPEKISMKHTGALRFGSVLKRHGTVPICQHWTENPTVFQLRMIV